MAMERLKQEYLKLYHLMSEKPIDLKDLDNRNSDFASKLDSLLEASNSKTDFSSIIFIGVFPLNTLNAQALKVESGFLILIHLGLMKFALQTAALIGGVVMAESRGAVVPQEIGMAQASTLFRKWTLALVKGIVDDETQLDFYPARTRFNFVHFLFASLMDFVVAHELSHVLCGHFDEEEVVNPDKIARKRIHYYTRSWQQELEADRVAMELVKKIYHKQVSEESMYLGPALFFEIVDAVSEVAVEQSAEGLSSHPPAEARRSAIITNTHSDGFFAKVPRVDSLVETIREIRGYHG
jgi:hypothetical protein